MDGCRSGSLVSSAMRNLRIWLPSLVRSAEVTYRLGAVAAQIAVCDFWACHGQQRSVKAGPAGLLPQLLQARWRTGRPLVVVDLPAPAAHVRCAVGCPSLANPKATSRP